ncbi:MAG TPA: MFS transporter, partial [Chitinophagaceae bacterium]|nr:MFS transporter [Chitinophagaceae bacterium]
MLVQNKNSEMESGLPANRRGNKRGAVSYLYKSTAAAALGGLLFGYDTAIIAGAIGFLKIKYSLSPAMEGWVASCALIGCIIGAMFSGLLSDKIGRKKVLMLCALLFGISSLGTAVFELNGFIFFRIMAGMAIGTASMVSPMYISEISPPEKRGSLISI